MTKTKNIEKGRQIRSPISSRWLLFWTLFIGVGAIYGGTMMLIDPSGKALRMDGLLPYFQVLPFSEYLFQDYIFSGIALLIVNGISNLTAAVLIMMKKKIGVVLGGIFGITLMLWICIQFVIFPPNFMSTSYFVFGLVEALTGYMTWVFQKQEEFSVDLSDYSGIGKDHTRLVVFFSRMGYVKKEAYKRADETGADIYEIKAKERTEGTLGFWWCGRFAMHRWDMAIEKITVDLSSYRHVTICTPIWVFSLSSPVREFCKEAKGKIREVDYILVHHTKGKYTSVMEEMDKLLGLTHTSSISMECHMGVSKGQW